MSLKCEHCGNDREFITEPNSYEVYEVIDNQLEYRRNEIIDEDLKLYCRDCSEELKIPENLKK